MKWFARRETVPALLVLLAFIAGAIESPYFLDFRYLLESSSLYVEAGLLALGMTLVIVSGQIDLSVASTMALAACTAAKLLSLGWSAPPAIVTTILFGAILGSFNGLLIAGFKLPSFVVTLGSMAAFRGIAQVMLGSESLKIPSNLVGIDFVKTLGTPVPLPLTILILVAVVVGLVLHRTVLGRWIYAVGTNARASLYSGVPTEKVTVWVFAISGGLASIAGLLIDSRLGVARFDHARGLEVDVITAVVLGGAAISGGSGSILGTMLALLLVGLIRTGMGLANFTAEYQLAVVGTLLVVTVIVGNIGEKFAKTRSKKLPPKAAPSLKTVQESNT
jgi:rhamnose transport system permease protein